MNPSVEQQIAQNQQAVTNLRFTQIGESQRRIEAKLDLILDILKLDEEINKGTKAK